VPWNDRSWRPPPLGLTLEQLRWLNTIRDHVAAGQGVTMAELMARDKASLDIFWLRYESLTDSDNLPPPDVTAQQIVDYLEAALEQFRLIVNDLGDVANVTSTD
jgi:hypothetical protein